MNGKESLVKLNFPIKSTDYLSSTTSMETDVLRMGPSEHGTLFEFFSPQATFYARNVMTDILRESQVLPVEVGKAISLIYGKHPNEISAETRPKLIKLIENGIEILEHGKNSGAVVPVSGDYSYAAENLMKRGYGTVRNLGALSIALEKTDLTEFNKELEFFRSQQHDFEYQQQKLFEALEKMPKNQIFIHDIEIFPSYDPQLSDGVKNTFSLVGIPSPVARWLPQIHDNVKSGKITQENASFNAEKIADFIKQSWKKSFSRSGDDDVLGSAIIEGTSWIINEQQQQEGTLYGLRSRKDPDHANEVNVDAIDLKELKRKLVQRIDAALDVS